MRWSGGERGRTDLAGTRTQRTLRDVLHELPVDALVPDGWRVGTEVVQFGDRLPADAVTLAHGDYPRDLLITTVGSSDGEALAVHERDRTAGDRRVVAGVAPADDDTAELDAALRAAARAVERIEAGTSGESRVLDRDPSASRTVEGADTRVNFY